MCVIFTDFETCEAEILAIRCNKQFIDSIESGQECGVLLDKTCFYAEQGGQSYDEGFITKGMSAFHTSASHTSASHTSASHTSAFHTSASHTSASYTSASHTSAFHTSAFYTSAFNTLLILYCY